MTHPPPLVVGQDLVKTFTFPNELTILRGVSLTVARGETVAIMGASGEGKSTLLHILGTLEALSSGQLWLAGALVTARGVSRIRNRLIGFVFQSFHLMEDYTALDNVLMPARIARSPIGRDSLPRKRALELLDRVGLSDRKDYPTKLLSGGEKQRVALARALINDPPLILADEPSGNLDRVNSEAIHTLLLELVKQNNKSLVTVTHDPSLASRCDSRLLLCDGKLSPVV